MKQYCPICNSLCCPSNGHSKDILVIKESPDDDEIRKGQFFASDPFYTTSGKVFRKELQRVGLSTTDFRITSLWQHVPNSSEECFQAGYNAVLDEAKGKKAILLVGADVVDTFTGYKVSEVSGLQVDSSILSAPLIMAMVSPALALSRSIGEVRFAVERWKFYLEKENLI